MGIAAELGVLLKPIAPGFWKKAEAQIESQDRPDLKLEVGADTKKATAETDSWRSRQQQNKLNIGVDVHTAMANAELEAFRERQEKRRLNFRVDLDKQSVKSLDDGIQRVEHYYKGNPARRAIRFQVYVVGATALPALTQGLISVAAAATNLARAGLVLPGVFAGIAASVATATTGFNGIGAALKASNDGLQNSSQYTRQYAQATRELQNAQRDVVTALKQANREIEDQKNKLAQGQLGVEQAQINVRRANQRMIEGGFKSITDYQQALLDVKQANLDLSTAVRGNSRDIQDYYDNASRGALASNTYKDSLDKLSNSVDNFHKAQFQAAGMSEQFINSMKNLAPAGQDFVLQVLQMRGAWRGLQSSVQTTLFSGVGDEITKLAKTQLPMLKSGMQNVAAGLNKDFKALLDTLGRQSNSNSISKIFDNTARALVAAKPGIESFVNGFLRLSEVGSRFLPRLALAFDNVMIRFEKFVNRADADGSLERWIDRGLDLVSSLGRSLMTIGNIFGSITTAYEKATGNIGGFATTMEGTLKKLSDYFASARGQRSLVEWINQSKAFIQAIKDDLPGIRNLFHTIGEGARLFAKVFYPILAGVGKFAEMLGPLAQGLAAFYIGARALGPIGSAFKQSIDKASTASAAYKKNLAALKLEYVDAAKAMNDIDKVRNRSLAIVADPKKSPQAVAARAAHAEAKRDVKAAKEELDASRAALRASQAEMAALPPPRRRNLGLNTPDARDQVADRNAKAIAREAVAQESLVAAQKQSRTLAREATQITNSALSNATRSLADSADDAAKAQTRLNTAAKQAIGDGGWFNKMKRGIGSGKGGGLVGALSGLATAFGGISAALGGAAITGSVIYAIDQYSEAKDRATMAANNMREAEERLQTTLAKGTGSATGETLEANLSELGSYKLPARKGESIDAIRILQDQAGISASEAASLALPTETKKREARLAPSDAKIIAAVPNLQQWKRWAPDYRANGVTPEIYGKALNGDQDSIGKVEAARRAIKDADPLGRYMNMGAAVASDSAPNDLGTAQQQLPTGADGGLRGLSQAAGAVRGVATANVNAGKAAQQSPIKQGGLNTRGSRAFGPFVLGPGGAKMLVDGSAVIEVDRYPDDVVRGWIDNAAPNGISVERRYPDGAVIKIDTAHANQYFNPAGKYAMGGPVWGAGNATSDSIPAMLSNGEFVINAKSASLIGHDKLHAMNSLRGYWAGGPVKRDGPGSGGSLIGPNGSTNNYFPTVPIVTNAQTIPEAIGLPTTPSGRLIGPAGAGRSNTSPGSVTTPPGDLPGFIGSLGQGSGLVGSDPNRGPKAIPKPPAAPTPPPIDPPPGRRVFGPPKAPPVAPGTPHVGHGQPGPGGRASTTNFPPLGPFTPSGPPVVSRPFNPTSGSEPLPPSAGQSSGTGARIGPGPNGAIYIPDWSGSGALPDSGSTGLSAVKNARVNPNANILDYLTDVANANGLRAGAGPMVGPEGQAIADKLGIGTHFNDGAQHTVNRALDIGSAEQAQSGAITSFVKDWIADPDKVAATRQLIYLDPVTKEKFGIINGQVLTGDALENCYGDKGRGDHSLWEHQDHVHLALEGVPLDAFDPSTGLGAPISMPGIGGSATLPAGPAVDTPAVPGVVTPDVPGGPAGKVPFDGMLFLKQIGAAILNGIFGFFGVDGSGFVDAIFNGFGKKEEPEVQEVPQPDEQLLSQMDQQIATYEGLNTPEGKSMAESLKKTKDNYLAQYNKANLADSTEGVAKYLESIGDVAGAAKLRENAAKANEPSEFLRRWQEYLASPQNKTPVLPNGPGTFVAPPAAYSGGTPETHNAIYRAFREAGYGDTEWPALIQLLNHENDTYDPTRPTGGPNSDARGIFQFLSSTWGAVGMTPSDDPYQQSVAGMKYIKQTYGRPSAAWEFWQHPTRPPFDQNWYSKGGPVAKFANGGMVRGGNPYNPYWEDGVDPLEAIYGPPFLVAHGPSKGGSDLSNIVNVFPEENAAGGYISGPGSGTSDSIPAMLSNGEFVMRAKAVDYWGKDKLHAMNCYSGGGSVMGDQSGHTGNINPGMKIDTSHAEFGSNPKPKSWFEKLRQNFWIPGWTQLNDVDTQPVELPPSMQGWAAAQAPGEAPPFNPIYDLLPRLRGERPDGIPVAHYAPGGLAGEDNGNLIGPAGFGSLLPEFQYFGMPKGDGETYSRGIMSGLGIPPLLTNPAGGTYGNYAAVPSWVQDFVKKFGGAGLSASSTPHGSLHGDPKGAGYAVDVTGTPEEMDALAQFLVDNPALSSQVIHGNPNTGKTYGVAGGVDVSGRYYTTAHGSYADETDMVHWVPAIRPQPPKAALGGLVRGYAPGGLVTNDNNNGQLSSWWENTKNFGKGFVGGATDLVTGIAPLVGLGPDGGPGVADSWKAMATGLAPLVGLGGSNAPGVGEAWKEFGKGAIRYDDWTGGKKAEAAGGNVFDILTAFIPGGALTKGVKAGGMGAKAAAESASIAAKAPEMLPKSITSIAPSMKTTLNLEDGVAGRILKPPRRGGVHPNPGKKEPVYNPFLTDNQQGIEGPELPPKAKPEPGPHPFVAMDGLSDFVRMLTPREIINFLSEPDPGYTVERIIEMAESGQLYGPGVPLPPAIDEALRGAIARRDAEKAQKLAAASMESEFLAGGDPLGAFMPGQSYLITPQEMAARDLSRPMDRTIYEELHRRIANPRVRPEISSAPRSGRLGGLRLGFGPADSYEAAAEYAKTIWPQAIEDIPVRASGSGLGGGAPGVEIPFTSEQFRTLRAYSGSSRVNKSLRGIQNLTGLRNILDELIRIRPDMSGPGGHIDEDFAVTKLFERNADTPLSLENFSASDNWILDPYDPDKRFGIRDSIELITENYRKYNRDLSTQQVWESIFISYLREARGRLGSAIGDKKAIELIDASFNQVPTLPRDMWATRMVEPYGADARLGEFSEPNPGFSSTSLGISRETELGGLQRAPVFSDRAIMQQLLLRRGTPALWFGGTERELLTPRGLQFMPEGMEQSGFTAYGRPGQELDPVTKMWGEAKFPETPPKIEIPGMNELDDLLMPLGQGGWSGRNMGNPGWMDLLAPPVPGKERSAFNVPEVFDLGYASGGHVTGPGGPKSDMIPAMLSNGEFVMNAEATKRIGTARLMAMNKFSTGGLAGTQPAMPPIIPPKIETPPDPADGLTAGTALGANVDLKEVTDAISKPLFPSAKNPDSGSSDPDAFKNLDEITPASLGSTLFSPKGGGGGGSASARAPRSKDPRAILGAAPTNDNHMNPALAAGIKGGFNTIGALASQAAAIGASAATAVGTGGAPVPGAGQAASALVSAGFQMAGDVAVGAANVISSLLVGTVTPSDTGQGYGAPLLPQQQPGAGMNNFQSIHNGNVVTNNLSEYNRLKDRKDAQKAAPFFSRVNQ